MTDAPRIELLAPAGDERALHAALAAGADAVYFGLERYSARAFAANFAGDEAARAVELAHVYDARAHLALNTLLKHDELAPALTALEAPYRAGLDALIVADPGLVPLVRERYADLELHASTQMNTHSSAQLAALERLGFRRAILARELSVDEIAGLDTHGLDLEAFVHGALCYGYSGDCLLSSMIGGRSGNRGRCSQSCRMRYMLTEGRDAGGPPPAGKLSRVLSTGDLCAIGALPQLLAAGVTSFKIEGRMKDAAYVAVAAAVYREALDAALADPEGYYVRPGWLDHLEQSFSRGFTTAHLDGRHHEVRSGGRGGHRGVLVGRVERVDDERGECDVRLSRPLSSGDVVYLYTSWGQTDPIRIDGEVRERLVLCLRERVAVKDRLFRLAAAAVGELARELTSGRRALRPVPLEARLEGRLGEPVRLTVRVLPDGPSASAVSARPLRRARTAALDEGRVRAAVGALGGTPYELETLHLQLDRGLFLSVADLKDVRRRALAVLDERRLRARRRPSGSRAPVAGGAAVVRGGAAEGRAVPIGGAGKPAPGQRAARARRTRSVEEGEVVLRLRPEETPIIGDDVGALCLDVWCSDSPDEVGLALARLERARRPVRCRLPEILFDADGEWLARMLALPWAAVYVRHLGLAARRLRVPVVLEYPLQGLNEAVAALVAGLSGIPPAAVVASPEASLDEIRLLADGWSATGASVGAPAPAVEVVAFGRQQVLHARDHLGRAEGLIDAPGPAAHARLLLEDAKGYVFPGEVDADGTHLFNARVTNLSGHLGQLRDAGVSRFIAVQSDMDAGERRAFAAGGLPALAAAASRERSTTGHLFRGVA